MIILQTVLMIFFNYNEPEDEDSEAEEYVEAYLNTRAHLETPNRIKNYITLTIMNCSERQFQQHFRMSISAFNWLLAELSPFLCSPRLPGRQVTKKMDKLLAVLWLLATPDSYRSVGERFDLAKSDLFLAFQQVINGLNIIAPEIIAWPNEDRRRVIQRKFAEKAGIWGAVGAIDGTYVRIRTPKENAQAYNNRKCFHSITLQGICDHELLFTDVFTGYPSAVSDIRIFRNSDIYPKFRHNHRAYFDEDQFILADKAYPIEKWCITPYISHTPLTPRQRNFNSKHAKTRISIEHAWAWLYGQIRRLRYLDMLRTDLIPATIVAGCVLHNICKRDPDDLADIHFDEGWQYVNEIRDDDNVVADAAELDAIHQQGLERRDILADALYRDDD